ncbi:MAG: hypothetical protein WED11_08775, partial [Natronospirillum sp.]
MDTKRYLACVSSNQSVGEQIHREVVETLVGMQTIATGLPFLALTEGYQWKLHQIALADADFYVFLLGGDYGPLSATGVGYVHRAYAFASATNKPMLVLHGERFGTAGDAIDCRRMNGLLAEIAKQVPVVKIDKQEDVREHIERFVDDLLESQVLKGWNPSGLWAAEEALQKDLLRQIDELRQRLEQNRIGSKPDQIAALTVPDILFRVKVFRDGNLTSYDHSLRLDWNKVFRSVAPLLKEPQRETDWNDRKSSL